MKQNRFHNIASAAIRTAFVAVLAMSFVSAEAAGKKKTTVKKKTVAVKKAPAKVIASLKPVVGSWTLHTTHDKEDRSIRINLNPDGTFVWKGSGWQSRGTYGFKERQLVLNWTAVDDMPVKPGSMKKTLELTEGLLSFKIDRFTYARQGTKLPAPQPVVETPAVVEPAPATGGGV